MEGAGFRVEARLERSSGSPRPRARCRGAACSRRRSQAGGSAAALRSCSHPPVELAAAGVFDVRAEDPLVTEGVPQAPAPAAAELADQEAGGKTLRYRRASLPTAPACLPTPTRRRSTLVPATRGARPRLSCAASSYPAARRAVPCWPGRWLVRVPVRV